MARYRKKRHNESLATLAIKGIGGILLLIFFLVPHGARIVIVILALGLACGAAYLIANYIAIKNKRKTEPYRNIDSSNVQTNGLSNALRTSQNAGVNVERVKPFEQAIKDAAGMVNYEKSSHLEKSSEIKQSIRGAHTEIKTFHKENVHFTKEDYERIEKNASDKKPPRYITAKSLITKGEEQFYAVLKKAVPEAEIHAKVRVSDVIQNTTGYIGDFRSISQFHFDWVICDPHNSKPILAVELDDSSHRQWRNKKNDETKNQAAKEAKFPILRFPWSKSYNEEEIRDTIAAIVNKAADESEIKTVDRGKNCPRCTGKLIERTKKTTGEKFLGCSGFPQCRYVENLSN